MAPETLEETPAVSRETCTRTNDDDVACGAVLDTTGYPRWCKACRAKHRRGYNATLKEMSETRGFAAGVSALRAALVRQFAASGGTFTGPMAARWVKNYQLPK